MAAGRILVLEPNRESLASRVRSLTRAGYRVTGTASTEEALSVVSEETYDLLVLRPESPALLNMLLARFPSDMASLIISPPDQVGQVAEGAGVGLHAFLVEPVTPARLREAIASTLNNRQSVLDALRDRALNILGQAQHLFTPGIDIDKYLGVVAEMSAIGTSADYVCISLKDKDGFRSHARHGAPKPGWEDLCTEAAAVTSSTHVCEGANHPLLPRLTASGASALLTVPLKAGEETVGAIHHLRLESKKPFADSDTNFAAVVGWWIGVALENQRLFQRVEQQRHHVDDLLQEVSHAQENERKRVAIEIHDGVAQWMVGANYGIKACAALVSQSRLTELQAELARISQTLQKSVRELRRTMANLRPLALEEGGLSTAIRQVLQPLTFPQETTTYWILQEALTNIRSHSGAREVDIHFSVQDNIVTVAVNDDGKGFNPEQTIRSAIPLEHMGLLGMQERARLLGGNLSIASQAGRGTTVNFSFPLSARERTNSII